MISDSWLIRLRVLHLNESLPAHAFLKTRVLSLFCRRNIEIYEDFSQLENSRIEDFKFNFLDWESLFPSKDRANYFENKNCKSKTIKNILKIEPVRTMY